jgi:hypothetical protein
MKQTGTRFVAALVLLAISWMSSGESRATPQPGYDTIRIDFDGTALPYQVWIDWSPFLLPMPDGGAWLFFSAQVKMPRQPTADDPSTYTLGTQKLFAAHFDPASNTWEPAKAMKGGPIQFGASAVVDAYGTVHVVYTDRASDQAYGTLVYVKSTPQGGWTDPVPVAPNPQAGHQLGADLVLDRLGGLHVIWQDQRNMDDAARSVAANADIFVSDLLPGGGWSEPVQVNRRPDARTNPSRPQLTVDGDRLISIWSIYVGTSPEDLATAQRIEWSTRPLADPRGWAPPRSVFERQNSQIGGRLLDLAANPAGGVALVYGRRTIEQDRAITSLYLQRLQPGSDVWDEPIPLVQGNRGSYPRIAIAPDGTLYLAYHLGSGGNVKVGAVALAPGADQVAVEEILTAGEEGQQGIPVVAVDRFGRPWVAYIHEPPNGKPSEIRVLRGAWLSTTPAPQPTPSPAASPAASATG